MAEQIQKTKEEHFRDSTFEWVKTDRSGEMCKFAEFQEVGGIEYVCFDDGTRVNISLIGDVVLMHNNSNDILGDLMKPPVLSAPVNRNIFTNSSSSVASTTVDPVVTILNKTKKRSEKMTLTVTVKIPSVEIFNVIRENFDDADDILMNDVIDQISGKMLIESVKRELANIYQKKKKP